MPSPPARPPGWALKFFRWYCNPALSESIEGDLEERFEDNLEKKGPLRAKIAYWLDVFRFINRYTMKPTKNIKAGLPDLLAMNLLNSYRFLHKNRSYTVINVTGLTLGLAVSIFIFKYAHEQYSFDDFFEKKEQVYRINNIYTDGEGNQSSLANSSPAFAPELPKSIAGYKKATRMRYAMRTRLSLNEIDFYEDRGYYADSVFLDILDYPLLAGNKETALDEPNSILITEELALKYFKESEPIGQFLTLNGDRPLKVTGILAPIPPNSHLSFDYLISFTSYVLPAGYRSDLTSWSWGGFFTYVLVDETTDIANLTNTTNALIASQFPNWNDPLTVHLQPLSDIYLGSAGFPDDLNSPVRSGNPNTLSSLIIIAIMILVICCFNFMNLTSATSLKRGREVGVRKVLGAKRQWILMQLLTDSLVLAFLSLTFALLLLNPLQNLGTTLGIDTQLGTKDIIQLLPWAVLGAFALSLLSTLYPAMVISSVKITKAIKGRLTSGKQAGRTRSALVGIQFCISIGLLTATMVIVSQARLLQNKDLGITKENSLVVKMLPEDMARYYETLKTAMEQSPHIAHVSQTERLVGEPWPVNGITTIGQDLNEPKQIMGCQVGYDFEEALGAKLKIGRSFSPDFSSDSLNAIIINEAAVKMLQLEDPIGKEVQAFSVNGPRRIIGVIEDFNFTSLHESIRPMAVVMPFIDLDYMIIRVSPGNLREKVLAVEEIWNNITADLPLELTFLDDHLNRLYQNEAQLGKAVTALSMLAVILSCLGLYGLIIFSIHNRLKEVSIRKVLGAKLSSLLLLLSKEYVILIGLGLLLAVPLSYYTLSNWLATYPYRINISPTYFLWAVLFFAFICLLAIGRQIFSTAQKSPIEALRQH